MWQRVLVVRKHAFPGTRALPSFSAAGTDHRSRVQSIRAKAFTTKIKRRWTPEEDKQLADMHVAGIKLKDMATMLPGRSAKAMVLRRFRLGFKDPKKPPPYSESEDDLLQRLRSGRQPWPTILAAFPHRSRAGLQGRLTMLKTAKALLAIGAEERFRYRWTEKDREELLSLLDEEVPHREIARRMSRSFYGVKGAVRIHGQSHVRDVKSWTAEEEESLRKGREAGLTLRTIHATLLPGRTFEAIKNKAKVTTPYMER